MSETINVSSTEARRKWFSLLDQVFYENKTFGIIKNNKRVAKLFKPTGSKIDLFELSTETALKKLSQFETTEISEKEMAKIDALLGENF